MRGVSGWRGNRGSPAIDELLKGQFEGSKELLGKLVGGCDTVSVAPVLPPGFHGLLGPDIGVRYLEDRSSQVEHMGGGSVEDLVCPKRSPSGLLPVE